MNKPAAEKIFEELEFKTLGKRLRLGKKLNQAGKTEVAASRIKKRRTPKKQKHGHTHAGWIFGNIW